jgi:hypothetical protein
MSHRLAMPDNASFYLPTETFGIAGKESVDITWHYSKKSI